MHKDTITHRGNTGARHFDMGETSRLLAAKIQHLAPELFPAGKRSGSHIRIGSLSGEAGGSLAIDIRPGSAGLWHDHSTSEGGDALDLVAKARFGGDKRKAMEWALSWLGINDKLPPPPQSRPVPARPPQPQSEPGLWQAVWREAVAPQNTPARKYLLTRGLAIPADAPLRFHPACPCGSDRFPALIALMTDPATNLPVGIHRTFLAADGSGKARIRSPKMMLGCTGVVRLVPDENVTLGLGLAEGIETSLSIMQRADWLHVWAATSAGGLASFPVLAGIQTLTIFADHDAPKQNGKQPGIDAAHKCAERWHAAGREVVIRTPPLGMDWDDALRVAS